MTTDSYHILFVEDDSSGRALGVFNLKKAGFRVTEAIDGAAGIQLFDGGEFDVVITDMKMPGKNGMEVLAHVKAARPEVPVLMITAYADVEMAVSAMKAGAFDFIGKPFSRDHLLLTIEKALNVRQMEKELVKLRRQVRGVERPIVAASAPMKRVMSMADRVATSDAPVLISGESGTGKELVARRIHGRSARCDKPFVAINAAAMPASLLESELFGHVRGAFTGAIDNRDGKFKLADGGTLFLDEIAEMPVELQVKLLRTLQEGTIDPLGSEASVQVNVRIIAATNKNLPQEVAGRAFREDLFYRLNVFAIEVPPLRERPDDIGPMVEHFLAKHGEGQSLGLASGMMDSLRRHHWPGNVRELENVCIRLALLAQTDEITVADLPFNNQVSASADADNWPPLPAEGLNLFDLEKNVIERVLTARNYNVSQAAVYLGIPRHQLAYRMQKYGIQKK